MKLSLNTPILDLDDAPVLKDGEPIMLGKVVAQSISMMRGTENAPKLLGWSRKLHRGNELDLPDSMDVDLFLETLKQCGLSTLALGQAMEAVSEARIAKKVAVKKD